MSTLLSDLEGSNYSFSWQDPSDFVKDLHYRKHFTGKTFMNDLSGAKQEWKVLEEELQKEKSKVLNKTITPEGSNVNWGSMSKTKSIEGFSLPLEGFTLKEKETKVNECYAIDSDFKNWTIEKQIAEKRARDDINKKKLAEIESKQKNTNPPLSDYKLREGKYFMTDKEYEEYEEAKKLKKTPNLNFYMEEKYLDKQLQQRKAQDETQEKTNKAIFENRAKELEMKEKEKEKEKEQETKLVTKEVTMYIKKSRCTECNYALEIQSEGAPIPEDFDCSICNDCKYGENMFCKGCSKYFATKASLKRHHERKKSCKDICEKPTEETVPEVPVTPVITEWIDSLLVKAISGDSDKAYCKFCEVEFANKSNLNKHLTKSVACDKLAKQEFVKLLK